MTVASEFSFGLGLQVPVAGGCAGARVESRAGMGESNVYSSFMIRHRRLWYSRFNPVLPAQPVVYTVVWFP